MLFFPRSGVLAPGCRGRAVFVLQLILATAAPHYANTAPVPLTGEYDPETAAAVRLMQGVFILPQTGVTDRATWDALAALHNELFMRTPPEWTI